ncbi:conjugal transfer protein TraD [Asaia lannensis]|uniref:conjugal transfer protein TraD n=1 Tax=Asaia lannensis TaxID=415421 RepID=UPI003872E292
MRKPRDIDGELKALQERTKALKEQRVIQFGELIEATGADALPIEALAGILLAAVDQAEKQPEAVARWTERGTAFFQRDGRKGSRKGKSDGSGTPAEPRGSGTQDREAGGSLFQAEGS